ncbi:MAG: enoyl-CoA hydratase/isomerase family protein, partial [bacterium]
MGQDNLLFKKENRIATITLNRPEVRNAMGLDERVRLIELVQAAEDDPEIRVLIITGAGVAFCSGGDVKTMPERAQKPIAERKRELVKAGAIIIHKLRTMDKPVIAMVNGAAVGMGLSLALGCDIRIASEAARFGAVFSRIGVSTDFGCAYLLTHLAGTAKA